MLNLWDIPHLELQGFPAHVDMYMRGVDCVVLVFDSSKPETLGAVDQWRNACELGLRNAHVPMLLFAHKSDLDQASGLPASDLDAYANAAGLFGWRFTSALSQG